MPHPLPLRIGAAGNC